jgi:hypothetical protein
MDAQAADPVIIKSAVEAKLKSVGYNAQCDVDLDLIDPGLVITLLYIRDGSGNGMWGNAIARVTGNVLIFEGFAWNPIGELGRRVFSDVQRVLEEGITLPSVV